MSESSGKKLVVASQVKSFIKETSGMNTSANVMEALSDVVAGEIKKGIENARRNNRKTVLDRDINTASSL